MSTLQLDSCLNTSISTILTLQNNATKKGNNNTLSTPIKSKNSTKQIKHIKLSDFALPEIQIKKSKTMHQSNKETGDNQHKRHESSSSVIDPLFVPISSNRLLQSQPQVYRKKKVSFAQENFVNIINIESYKRENYGSCVNEGDIEGKVNRQCCCVM